jgi:hypothetical protein
MTDEAPFEAEARIKKMYPHLYSRYSRTADGVKPPPAPQRKENRHKNVRSFFGAKSK